jgi:hypothetical protein
MSTTQHLPDRSVRLLTALCGLVGVVALVVSFAINPGPQPGMTPADMVAFANQHRTMILLGSWLQGIGSVLDVLFILALVDLAGAGHRFAGWLTLFAGTIVVMVSLVEVTGYLIYAQAAASGDPTDAVIGSNLAAAAQHVFLVAPALMLSIAVVLLGSHVLPRVFGYLALVLGCAVQILGLVGLYIALQPLIDNVLTIQLVWMAAAAVTVVMGRDNSATSGAPVPLPLSSVDDEERTWTSAEGGFERSVQHSSSVDRGGELPVSRIR